MRLSSVLTESLTEETLIVEGFIDPHDMARSLNSLVKHNDGEWKSDRQAKYLLMTIRDRYQPKEAVKWAKRQGLYGKGVVVVPVVTKLKGYGRVDPSKIRYLAQVFVLDGSGVVARAKLKYKHFTKKKGYAGEMGGSIDGIDWTSGKLTYQRETEPSRQYVDLEREDAKKARKEAAEKKIADKQIALIQGIPDWMDKPILLDFMVRLRRGVPLTQNQLAVVQSMSPEDIFVGGRKQWIRNFDEFKTLVVDKILVPWRELERNHVQQEQERWDAATPEERRRNPSLSKPNPQRDADVDHFIMMMRAKGHPDGYVWIENWVFGLLTDLVLRGRPTKIYSDAPTFDDIWKQYSKAIKTKRPTKKAVRVMTFIAKAVERLRNMNEDAVRLEIMKRHNYREPPAKTPKPSQALSAAVSGYTVPSPSKFGF